MVKSLSKLLLSILLTQSVGFIGSIFTISAIPNWYNSLNLPYFKPPNSLFGPVWLILYTLIGISLYWVWVSKEKNKNQALKIFFLHLALNTSWSIIFFGLKQIFIAALVLIVILVTLLMVMKKFYKIDPRATGILFPYLVWVTFATLLNIGVWVLNM